MFDAVDGQPRSPEGPAVVDDRPGPAAGPSPIPVAPADPGRRTEVLLGAVRTIRPLLFAVAAGLVVLLIHLLAVRAQMNPYSGRTQYGLHVGALGVAGAAALVAWRSSRSASVWGADLIPALLGGLGALTLLTALHGTPFDLAGVNGDQLFRTEAVTRFADSWRGGDYTYRGLPSYYAPTYFWVLGRVAAIAGIAPWHMLKLGTIAVAFIAPLVSYLLWRRIVSPPVAALISAIPLIAPQTNETYAWLAQTAFIPWWLEVGHGIVRSGLRRRHSVLLGLIGALLFTTYYYYFFLIPILLCIIVIVALRRGGYGLQQARRTGAVLAIAAVGAAPFWAPLAWNIFTAPEFEPLNNRWLTTTSGRLGLPMLEISPLGALCMLGLVFLVVTAKEALSRSLLIMLTSMYVWNFLGFFFTAIDRPLMSFRMRELIPLVLLAAAAMALARMLAYLARRFTGEVAWRLTIVGVAVLMVFVAGGFVTRVTGSPAVQAAHNQILPNGKLPPYHDDSAKEWDSPPDRYPPIIDAQYKGSGHPVVLADRSDLLALYPYYGFVQWNANYSHPTARYHDRIDFLEDLAKSGTPAEFADRLDNNPYDRVDVICLRDDAGSLVFRTRDDNFPFSTRIRTITIPARLVQPEYFQMTIVNEYLLAVRR